MEKYRLLVWYFTNISGWSQIIPVIISIRYYRQLLPELRPIVWLLVAGSINELISYLSIKMLHTNTYSTDIYVLGECLLLLYFFYTIHGRKYKTAYSCLALVSLIIWLSDTFVFHTLHDFNFYFECYYPAVVTFLCIDAINKLIVFEGKDLLKNPYFLILIAILTFYSLRTFCVLFFILWPTGENEVVTVGLFVTGLSNLFANLIYTIAFLCNHQKPKFTSSSW